MSWAERRLIRRLKDRDERAFRELVEEHQDRVFNITYRMLGNREEAEDVAQEVFITVFKSIDSFRGESKFSTWIYRISTNLCKNRLKYLARRQEKAKAEFDETVSQRSVEAGLASTTNQANPQRILEGQQLEGLMQEALAELEEEHRILIVLRDLEELNYTEICEITELPEGTVKSRLHRARLALRKKISNRM